MGLMLSVLVFCVGVAEVLDCWHHFLLHLVQPQYNPLPYSLDPKRDILCENELYILPEPRRTSNVDICWPKDLSPTDDLHVIKKRSHSESERNLDDDGECSGCRIGVKSAQHEKDANNSCSPLIVVNCPDAGDNSDEYSPSGSWDSSPNHLELSIITESDSSSEVDEPSQIENLAYKKKRACECETSSLTLDTNLEEVVAELKKIKRFTDEEEVDKSQIYEGEIPRPKSPSWLLTKDVGENVSHIENIRCEISSLTSSPIQATKSLDLPVFTDNIISNDVKKVVCRYPTNNTSTCLPTVEQTNTNVNITDVCDDFNTAESISLNTYPSNNNEMSLSEYGSTTSDSSILEEDLELISEFPEIRLMESSPIPPEQSSESSLNTSDASWLVKSKTSDRPLVVRFSPSPQFIQKEFESVTKTDLQAFRNKASSESSAVFSEEKNYEARDVQDHIETEFNASLSSITNIQQLDEARKQEDVFNESYIVDGCEINENKIPFSSVQPDTNSSSSSLSGIPQLPEDFGDAVLRTYLPSEDGSQIEHLDRSEESIDIYNSDKDGIISPLVLGENKYPDELNVTGSSDQVEAAASESEEKLNKDIAQSKNSPQSPESNVDVDAFLPKLNNNSKNLIIPILDLDERLSNPSDKKDGVKQEKESYLDNKMIQEATTVKTTQIAESKIQQDILRPVISSKDESTSSENVTHLKGSEKMLDETDVSTSLEEKKKVQQKDKIPKKQRKKRSSHDLSKASAESKTEVVICQAKESDEEDRADSKAQLVCVIPRPSSSEVTNSGQEIVSNPGPSTSEAIASKSKEDVPENKAFWLIFSGQYTKAMNKDWHSGHFCCWQCDESLTGQRYVLRDEHPYCIKCYESVFANGCEECNKTIGIDSKDLSYKDKHWHEACFLCNKCRVSLVDKQFGSKLDKIFCGNCYDAQFASRCDGCGQIFKAGTKKMEYKTRQWHEPCFACCVCKTPIGTKSFIPREQEIYCSTCYEEKFATRCVKCNKIITSGGVTYKNEPWHRECFTCTNCSTSLAGQRFTSRDEKPYCADCFGELFAKRCTACSKPITGIGGTRFISFEDRHWHNDCFICASCKTSLVGRGFITDAEDIICPECAKQKLI